MNSIKKDNLMSVFCDIRANSSTTRSHISERANLSVVTVSKAVEHLTAKRLTDEFVHTNHKLGRNVGLIQAAKNSIFLVIDLSHKTLEYSLINLNNEFIQRDFYFYNPSFIFEDNLRAFLNSVRERIAKLKNYSLLNIGILLPTATKDYYINKQKTNINYSLNIDFGNIISESLGTDEYLCEYFLFSAFNEIASKYSIEPDNINAYFSMINENPSILMTNSKEPKLLYIGKIPVTRTLCYSQILNMRPDLSMLKEHTTFALCSLVSVADPKIILLDDDNYTFTTADILKIEKDVSMRTATDTQIIQYKNDFAIIGIVNKMIARLINQ